MMEEEATFLKKQKPLFKIRHRVLIWRESKDLKNDPQVLREAVALKILEIDNLKNIFSYI